MPTATEVETLRSVGLKAAEEQRRFRLRTVAECCVYLHPELLIPLIHWVNSTLPVC